MYISYCFSSSVDYLSYEAYTQINVNCNSVSVILQCSKGRRVTYSLTQPTRVVAWAATPES